MVENIKIKSRSQIPKEIKKIKKNLGLNTKQRNRVSNVGLAQSIEKKFPTSFY